MSDYWFKVKTHGYGAVPTDWRGWALIAAFGIVDIIATVWLIVIPATQSTGPSVAQIAIWLAIIAAAILALLAVTKAKTDGQWRWRWGSKK